MPWKMPRTFAPLRLPLLCIAGGLLLAPLLATALADDFAQATRAPYQPPPEKSINGKSLAEMKADVEKRWDTLVFEKDGRPVVYKVVLDTDAGAMEVEFYPELAPNHVRSFLALCHAGFYDGLIFHRCIPGFVIQGGCPSGTGTGGPGYCLKSEFSDKPHVRGVLSMARAQPEDSAGSQFFICVDAARSLDNKYTVFGRITKGLEVADKIVEAPRDFRDRPNKPVKIKTAKVTVSQP